MLLADAQLLALPVAELAHLLEELPVALVGRLGAAVAAESGAGSGSGTGGSAGGVAGQRRTAVRRRRLVAVLAQRRLNPLQSDHFCSVRFLHFVYESPP